MSRNRIKGFLVVIAGEHAKNTKIGSLKKCENFFFFSANLQCQTCREDKKFFEIKLKIFFFVHTQKCKYAAITRHLEVRMGANNVSAAADVDHNRCEINSSCKIIAVLRFNS
jgi:predicted nucleic-acid-binding Zn-ribbon protein